MVPHDVPFDERLFESNALLKQYWENSVNGRSSVMSSHAQRRAEEDDHKFQTLELYNNLLNLTANQEAVAEEPEAPKPTEDVVTETFIETPEPAGPIMKPKASSYGLSVLSLVLLIVIAVLAGSVIYYRYAGFPRVAFFRGGEIAEAVADAVTVAGGEVAAAVTGGEIAPIVQEVIAPVAAAAAPVFTAGKIARFEL